MKGRVRIRGIYATALTSIFSSLSYEIVQQSVEIAERFMREVNNLPADITIKDFEYDRGKIIVMGNGTIEEDLHDVFKYSFHWKSPIKLYSVIEADESCTYGNFKVEPCLEEGIVIKPPYDGKIVLSETKAVSKYAMVWRGKGVTTFSEHINNEEERL
jgi:Ribonuclease G/E